jgi:ligand-binding SRPBCC domain-containing protein
MPVIKLDTYIQASREVVFDLSRDIDLHQISTRHTNEKAIAGKTSGLIGLGETVTWQARHFGVTQKLSTKITAFQSPEYFVDEMLSGAFHSFKHEHLFLVSGQGTLMRDVFDYVSPLGLLGRLADRLFLQNYMKKLLSIRNLTIKEHAEKLSRV